MLHISAQESGCLSQQSHFPRAHYRGVHGISQKHLVHQLNVDSTTRGGSERNVDWIEVMSMKKLEVLFPKPLEIVDSLGSIR
jgi:hypothetical protein